MFKEKFNIKRLLSIIVIAGFIFELLSVPLFLLTGYSVGKQSSSEGIYGILNWIIPILSALVVAIYLFSSKRNREVQMSGNISRRIIEVVLIMTLMIITLILSWVVLITIGLIGGWYNMTFP